MAARPGNPNMKRASPVLVAVIALIIVVALRNYRNNPPTPPAPRPDGTTTPAFGPGEYMFCFWNVENLFDDVDDKRGRADEQYDTWFSESADDLQTKLDRLTKALLKLNGGKGPDVLCICEVENVRAADLLREALNAKLPKDAVSYDAPLMEEVRAGRHIAPAILTRLPVVRDRTRGFGIRRIVEARVVVGEKELVVIASHWTSQLTDDTGEGREKYADQIYGRVHEMTRANPKVDVVVCGDFNADPDTAEVRENLRAVADRTRVTAIGEWPNLLNLMAGKDPKDFGTHYYNKPLIYDHLVVTAGMLDGEGWSCDPASARTITDGLLRPGSTVRRPWRFGNRKDDKNRGFSDHFPVVVKLRVQ